MPHSDSFHFVSLPVYDFEEPALGFQPPGKIFQDPLLGKETIPVLDSELGFQPPSPRFEDPLLGKTKPIPVFEDPALGFEPASPLFEDPLLG